ncbi:hypothetical protein TNCV_4640531 [Trichonephila clavipes]|nr:hypothetical protein TNCV_4640531 [Trichonephila clavipes]
MSPPVAGDYIPSHDLSRCRTLSTNANGLKNIIMFAYVVNLSREIEESSSENITLCYSTILAAQVWHHSK